MSIASTTESSATPRRLLWGIALVEVADFPFWQRHSTAAVIGHRAFAAVAAAGLLVAIAVIWRSIADRRSGAVAARV